jgi:hypothetical protein
MPSSGLSVLACFLLDLLPCGFFHHKTNIVTKVI